MQLVLSFEPTWPSNQHFGAGPDSTILVLLQQLTEQLDRIKRRIMADSLACSLEGRAFQALLNGLSKKMFHDDSSITYDYLIEQLFAGKDLEPAEIMAQIKIFEKVLPPTF